MISISLFVIALISLGTYAIWNSELFTDTSSISTGQVKMSYIETNELSISDALPMKDEDGKVSNDYFDFQILTYIKTNKNDSTERILNYNVILEPIKLSDTNKETTETNEIDSSSEEFENAASFLGSLFKVYLTKVVDGKEEEVTGPINIADLADLNDYILKSQEEVFKNGKDSVITYYRLRIWMDEDVDPSEEGLDYYTASYKFRVNVNSEATPTRVTPALKFAKSKVGTDGLELVTHTIDDTLQVSSAFSTEYRYRGTGVNNYVTFNDEVWRIIGILPTEDTDGNVEYRFKLIRNKNIGERMNWNTAEDTTTNSYNNWVTGTLNTYLNGDYYNSLSTEAQSMIGTTKYYLGGYNSAAITSDEMWQYERKNDANRSGYYYGTNPVVQSDSNKKIALMYASDYGYSVQTSCTNLLYNLGWCSKWLSIGESWCLDSDPAVMSTAFYTYEGKINGHGSTQSVTQQSKYVYPVLSLASNVKITDGSGTSENPYILG